VEEAEAEENQTIVFTLEQAEQAEEQVELLSAP
jgi:hypothetical protein